LTTASGGHAPFSFQQIPSVTPAKAGMTEDG
jgi:hypothetical protein